MICLEKERETTKMRSFLIMFVILFGFYNEAYGKGSLDIDMKLKALNKPALKTIKSQDGDIIDCIDIYKQHAFDHPALRNHKIQMKPSVEFGETETKIPNNGSAQQITSQIWSKSGDCPDGTIPVRRVSREDIRRASSPSHFGRKTPHRYSYLDNALQHKGNFNFTVKEKINRASFPTNRSEAFIVALGYNFLGARSDLNVWNPPRVQPNDYSTGQIWLLAGVSSDNFESIEAGWMVNPGVFGDYRTRFFISWTSDGYQNTGCINLLCSGFVQTNKNFALGATIEPVSRSSQEQYFISVNVFLDPNNGNWWLNTGINVIGYWPGELFSSLKHSAIAVQWGGEVYSPNMLQKPHTETSMGSGQWADYLYAEACYHTNLRIKDNSLQIKYPKYLNEYADESDCYTTRLYRKTYMSEPYLYFGGPGRSRFCP
ncbi:hypothetical protein CARUB_v10003553mg [Capsella rubella]|uniref:Neprosin PEP catalytic domain-containing protein n=1 Tax=Capsella rubella TaxID=81985 RepID=R0H0S1_9BRAS|nr:hypothetical protein CARUB_v10003553mg [Capsella rubella]